MVLNHLVNHLVRNDKIQNTEKLCFAYLVSPWADWCHINMQPQVPGDFPPLKPWGGRIHNLLVAFHCQGASCHIRSLQQFLSKPVPVSYPKTVLLLLLHILLVAYLGHVWTMPGPFLGYIKLYLSQDHRGGGPIF